MPKKYIVTGGAGFIGSCFVLQRVNAGDFVVNLDNLSYAGTKRNIQSLEGNPNHLFVKGDIGNAELMVSLLNTYRPDAVINFAAETHVDRSIEDPEVFLRTNVLGTEIMLRTILNWWKQQTGKKKNAFRFHHISTDEVFGSLDREDPSFTEESAYSPNSPYAASKASSDHFVRAFNRTYGLPTLTTNCSNNYGPRQFPEKFIPLLILNALSGKKLPIYGEGSNIRDWLFVEDHCEALHKVLTRGQPGETYNIGGRSEKSNNAIAFQVCKILDNMRPLANLSYTDQIVHVKDRPGHDFRYSINCDKIEKEIGWKPKNSFEDGLKKTVLWYLENPMWVEEVSNKAQYQAWISANYKDRGQ